MSQPAPINAPGAKISVIRRLGDIVVVDATSKSLHSIQAIHLWVSEIRVEIDSMKERKLIINLGGYDYLPGPIMNALITLFRLASSRKIRFALCEIGPENRKVIKAARLGIVIGIGQKEKDAVLIVNAKQQKPVKDKLAK